MSPPDVSAAVRHYLGRLSYAGPVVRQRTLAALASYGDAAREPLCEGLEDGHPRVRFGAIEALGELGGEWAIQPLTNALRAASRYRSARRQRLMAWWGLLGVLAALVLIVLNATPLLPLSVLALWLLNSRRRDRSGEVAPFLRALSRIAERCPSPSLLPAAAELREISADAIGRDASLRRASRDAAVHLEGCLEQLKSLPVSAASTDAPAEQLPIPMQTSKRES